MSIGGKQFKVGQTNEMQIRTARISASLLTIILAIFISLGGGNSANAQVDRKVFRVSIAGFPVGTASYDALVRGNRYEVQGFMGSTGFFGAFLASRYSGAVIGRVRGERLQPQIFRGRFEQSRKFAEVDIKYSGSRPVSVVRRPDREPQPYDINYKSVRNALDPISGLYYLLRDVTVDKVCTQNFRVFEGNRTSRIWLRRAQGTGGSVICNGVYTRVSGFSPEQMKERVNFPFRLIFEQNAEGLFEVREFSATTFWGVAKATLREG